MLANKVWASGEMVDALRSGRSKRKFMGVRISPCPPHRPRTRGRPRGEKGTKYTRSFAKRSAYFQKSNTGVFQVARILRTTWNDP